MNDESKVLVWKMFFGTVAFAIFMIGLWTLFIPKDYSFTIKMDDNTLKALETLNQSLIIKTTIETQAQIEDKRMIGKCRSVGECFRNESLVGCIKQRDNINYCCNRECSLLDSY